MLVTSANFSAVAFPDGTLQLCRVSPEPLLPPSQAPLRLHLMSPYRPRRILLRGRRSKRREATAPAPLSWSEECSTPTRFRSSGVSGRRGRLARELIACLAGKNSYCDCCCFVQAATHHWLTWALEMTDEEPPWLFYESTSSLGSVFCTSRAPHST